MIALRHTTHALGLALTATLTVLVPVQGQALVPVQGQASAYEAQAAGARVTMRDLKAVVAGSKFLVKGKIAKTGQRKNKNLIIEWKASSARPLARSKMSGPVSRAGWQQIAKKKHVNDGKYTIRFTSKAPGSSTLRARLVKNGRTLDKSPAKVLTILPPVPDDPPPPPPPPGSSLKSGLTGAVDPSNPLITTYLDTIWANVATYWQNNYNAWGYGTTTAGHYWPAPGESVYNACNGNGGGYEVDDWTAYYCPVNDWIIFPQQAAVDIWNGLYVPTSPSEMPGDFAVAFVLAHEFGHNITWELGWGPQLEAGNIPVRSRELHADCLAGTWAYSAYYQGILEAGDVEEAIGLLMSFGTPGAGTGYPTGHERHIAFMWGYNSGAPSNCDGYIQQYW